MNCDIFNTDTNEIYLNFNLINSPASHIWTHTIYQNQLASKKLSGYKDGNHKTSNFINKTERLKFQEKAVAQINDAIKIVNEGVIGQTFPYEAYVGMDLEHCIKIHRAFTIGVTSTVGWFHEGTEKQKYKFKKEHAFGPVKRGKIRSATPSKFTLRDPFRKGNYWDMAMEDINQGVHSYEATLDLPNILDTEMFTYRYSVDYSTFLSIEEYEESIKPKYRINNPQVFIYACIHGRDYIETYRIDDDPTEFDVVNIENISSDFRIIFNPEKLYKPDSLTATDFQKWVQSYNIDINYALPVPLGWTNYKLKEDKILDMTLQAYNKPGSVDIRFNL